MKRQVLVFECNGEIAKGTHYSGGSVVECEVSVKDLPDDDFIFACGYLLDEIAKGLPCVNKPFEGKTVCVVAEGVPAFVFTAGKIYEWKDGRTVANDGALYPSQTKLYSLDEITNPRLKFIKLVED